MQISYCLVGSHCVKKKGTSSLLWRLDVCAFIILRFWSQLAMRGIGHSSVDILKFERLGHYHLVSADNLRSTLVKSCPQMDEGEAS